MGAVLVKPAIHDAFMARPGARHRVSARLHLFRPTRWPLPAALATLKLYADEQLFARAASLQDVFMDAALSPQSRVGVKDVRTLGLVAGIELTPWADKPAGARLSPVFRPAGSAGDGALYRRHDCQMSPPLISSRRRLPSCLRCGGGGGEAVEVNR